MAGWYNFLKRINLLERPPAVLREVSPFHPVIFFFSESSVSDNIYGGFRSKLLKQYYNLLSPLFAWATLIG